MKACYIGDPDNNHDGPNITTMFGLSFRKMEWRDVSELGERELRKLTGNKHFAVGEEEGEVPVASGPVAGLIAPNAAASVSTEPVALEIAPDASGDQLIVLRSGNMAASVEITFHGAGDDAYKVVLQPGQDTASMGPGQAPVPDAAQESDATPPLSVPDDWRTAHHKTRMAWARQIKGAAVENAQEADHVISQYRGEDAEDEFSELDPED